MPTPLDAFLPIYDVRERHRTTVRAPAETVYTAVLEVDLQRLPSVRAIFWLRSKLMRAGRARPLRRGFIDELRGLGWGCLEDLPGERLVFGAACRPWLADVVFQAVPADRFQEFAEPDQVKIAWSLEIRPHGPATTELATETRACATDAAAREHFLRYWRWARFGIIPIRRLLLAAIRRQAEAAERSRP